MAPRCVRRLLALVLGALLFAGIGPRDPAVAAGTVDEIHFSFGDTSASVVFHWRGDSSLIEYGPTPDYGQSVTALAPSITPVDSSGPFWEATLDVTPDTLYHYRIGGGEDHTFRSQPVASFRWVDLGDTGSTLCSPSVATTHAQVAAAGPHFVTHGGDVSYANECGVAAVHQYYVDQETWSRTAAMQPVWGNHEYGSATTSAPAGTPRDSLANYKGRSYVTHPQTVPTDTATKTSHPGCAPAAGTTTNGCRGEDWGWFQVGGVLYISYPEPWPTAMSDWRTKADTLMATAQADPAVDFIVTYGHRPAYSSQLRNSVVADVTTALNALGDKYSPTARGDGKYVLNVAHHVHGEEVFSAQHGVVHITNGGGGEGTTSYTSTAAGSIFLTGHLGFLIGDYSATDHKLAVQLICGPVFGTSTKYPCVQGTVLYSTSFAKSTGTPPRTTDYFATCDKSVEVGLSCFSSKYSSSTTLTWSDAGGQDGSHAVRVGTSSATGGVAGVSAKVASAHPVTSTTTGTSYVAGAWVKASTTGQKISLLVKERRSDGTSAGSTSALWTATDTSWHQLSTTYVAKEGGNALTYSVTVSNLAGSTDAILADSFRLTSG